LDFADLKMSEVRAWDRQSSESAKAYRAFTIFLDLGPDRSLDAAYRSHKGVQGARRRAPGLWQRWYAFYKWKERADLYDRHVATQHRLAKEEEHRKMIEQHTKRAVQLSRSMFAASLRAISLATQRLENMDVLDLDVRELSAVLRAAAHLGQVSMVVEQDALGIQALMEKLQHLNEI
jgi:hypothetical protein